MEREPIEEVTTEPLWKIWRRRAQDLEREKVELESKLKRIVDLGHNNDCIFCGLKDKEALTRLKGA